MASPDEVTQRVSDAVQAAASADATVTGGYDLDAKVWTWLLSVPNPLPELPDASITISRQFVSTEEAPVPSAEYVNGLVTEMVTTAALSRTTTEVSSTGGTA